MSQITQNAPLFWWSMFSSQTSALQCLFLEGEEAAAIFTNYQMGYLVLIERRVRLRVHTWAMAQLRRPDHSHFPRHKTGRPTGDV